MAAVAPQAGGHGGRGREDWLVFVFSTRGDVSPCLLHSGTLRLVPKHELFADTLNHFSRDVGCCCHLTALLMRKNDFHFSRFRTEFSRTDRVLVRALGAEVSTH